MAAYTAAAFIEAYPEFTATNSSKPLYVARKLAEAASYCDPCAWGVRYEDAVYLKAADLLSMSPFGESARLNKFSEKTTYQVTWERMLAALPVRGMLV